METNHKKTGTVGGLIDFLNQSPVNFLAVDSLSKMLESNGFKRLDASGAWPRFNAGDRYYVVKNGSACFAFIVGDGSPSAGCKIIAAHSDSPGFRIKWNPEIKSASVVKLNTEVYGGPILYTWFDRPLSVAGRVMLRSEDPLHPKCALVKIDRPILTIPHLAIHFNRAVNEGNPLSRQKDMLPVMMLDSGDASEGDILLKAIAGEMNIRVEDILDFDLLLYDTTPAMLLGLENEFISSGRLDDLEMAYAAVASLVDSSCESSSMTRIAAIFDNEETGSGTKQGAGSPVLADIMDRIVTACGGGREDWHMAVENSFLISADNAHATHPNYVEKQDPTNHPVLGGGPVIKYNANCKYMTDADSGAVFREICSRAGVPVQTFVNHSDIAGGSTLGNILTGQMPLRGVDMGAGIWAMHSVRETASVTDYENIVKAFTKFYTL